MEFDIIYLVWCLMHDCLQTNNNSHFCTKIRQGGGKPPTKNVQPLKDAKIIKKMQGWWVKYAEKSRLEKKTTEGLKRSSIGEVAIVPASSGQARGSDYDHSTVLENSTPRRPIEPEVI